MKNQIEYLENGININGEFISLVEITKNVNLSKMKNENLVVLLISWPETRGCDEITEQIALSKKDAERVKSIIVGKEAYFGEIAGKHSEIYGEIEESEVAIQDNEVAVTSFLRENPSRHECNHSFINAIIQAEESEMIELNADDIDFLSNIY